MHYKDGTPAQIGDVVKGKGYNVKDKDGKLKEIIGTVVGLTPGSQSCNIQVAHVIMVPMDNGVPNPPYKLYLQTGVVGCGPEGGNGKARVGAYADLEYGECAQFELVYRAPSPLKADKSEA